MCAICDGMSREEMHAQTHQRIGRYGYTMLSIHGPHPWTYTIGLSEKYEHPELIVTGLDDVSAYGLIEAVADRILAGERCVPSYERLIGDHPVRFGDVHPSQWSHGRFDGWKAYYGWLGHKPSTQEAVQIVWSNDEWRYPPDPGFCIAHDDCQPLLSAPAHRDVNRRRR